LSLAGFLWKNPYEILTPEEIEADGYGQNAELGVRMTKFLLGGE
jgi:hypothetical protein